MNFYENLEVINEVFSLNPYSVRKINGSWEEGLVSIEFLNKNFGRYNTADEMIEATESEGLKLYFAWLRDEKGILN